MRWMGISLQLYYVESSLNHVDPVSRALHLQKSRRIILEARARGHLYYKCGSLMCWVLKPTGTNTFSVQYALVMSFPISRGRFLASYQSQVRLYAEGVQ